MSGISTAIDISLQSKVVGYDLQKGNFSTDSPNLPQRIVIFGEANENMQDSVTFDQSTELTTAQQAGNIFGFGSPIHMAMRILRPNAGSGVQVPIVAYAQEKPNGATTKRFEIVATGVATANVTHTLEIAGRRGVDGQNYNFVVNTGDDSGDIHQKIEDAINAVLGSPVKADSTDYESVIETKWAGLTANDVTISVFTNGNSAGITYTVDVLQQGSGTPTIQASLNDFGQVWNTVVLNTYGLQNDVCEALEAFNGKPAPVSLQTGSGRYSPIVWKPFFAFSGYTKLDMTDATTFTDARKTDVTIVVCPAPGSNGLPLEASANCVALYAPQASNNPHLDISGQSYPDMPTPTNIGDMDIFINRDSILKKGCSTVQLNNGAYEVMDFVTTYHPDGELVPQYRYVRSLTIDMNFRYAYFVVERQFVVDQVIAQDSQIIDAPNVIKPSGWKQILATRLLPSLSNRGLITDLEFSISSIRVTIGQQNPDRFETVLDYKRSGFVRQASTTVRAGFNFNS